MTSRSLMHASVASTVTHIAFSKDFSAFTAHATIARHLRVPALCHAPHLAEHRTKNKQTKAVLGFLQVGGLASIDLKKKSGITIELGLPGGMTHFLPEV